MLNALLVNDASLAGHHGSALVTARCAELARTAGIRLATGWDWQSGEAALAGAHDFDLVIVNGEGSIHHDSKTARRIAALAGRLREQRLPAYLVNASEEANGPDVIAGLAKFRRIFVRDTASRASLAQHGVMSEHVPDLTLTWADAPRYAGGSALFVTDASDAAIAARLLALAGKWRDTQAVSLRCAPPAPSRGGSRRRIMYRLKRWLAPFRKDEAWSLRYAGGYADVQSFAKALAEDAQGLVSGRYHAVCLALVVGTPFNAIEGNIGKVGGLLADAGLSHRLVALEHLESLAQRPEIAPFSDEERARIEAFLQFGRERAATMFAAIAQDAADAPRRSGRG